MTQGGLDLIQGTLHRLERKGRVESGWRQSEKNQRMPDPAKAIS